jgi:ATP-dependent HslUV protease subunit HslV
MIEHKNNTLYGTTIVSVRKDGKVAISGDGQVSFGQTVLKSTAVKVRKIGDGSIVGGFAGATADAFTLFERLEAKLEKHNKQLKKSCVELAKDWRSDKYLRKLEAMMIVVDVENSFVLTGNGDVVEPEDGVIAIGSGGNFALSAARALKNNTDLSAQEIAEKSINIAAELCVYTNSNITTEVL